MKPKKCQHNYIRGTLTRRSFFGRFFFGRFLRSEGSIIGFVDVCEKCGHRRTIFYSKRDQREFEKWEEE